MTLIVAAACKDGVVVAADSQITAGQATRFTSKKLRQMGSRIIWGAAGTVGVTQVIEQSLEKHDWGGAGAEPIEELRNKLVDIVNPVQRRMLATWVQLPGTDPPHAELLFAGYTAGQAWIFGIGRNGSAEIRSQEGFAAIGSGGAFANVALASLAHYDLPNTGVELGSALIYRAMEDIIRTSAHGVDFPIRVGVVTSGNTRLLDQWECDRIARDANYIGELEAEAVRNAFAGVIEGSVQPPPAAPQPRKTDQ